MPPRNAIPPDGSGRAAPTRRLGLPRPRVAAARSGGTEARAATALGALAQLHVPAATRAMAVTTAVVVMAVVLFALVGTSDAKQLAWNPRSGLINPNQHAALRVLKQQWALGGSNCTLKWDFTKPCNVTPGRTGYWHCVSCKSGSVVKFDIENQGIRAPLPEVFTQLTALSQLYLTANNFTGSIPLSWTSLSRMEVLYLGSNKLSGPLPAYLARMPNLAVINLSTNKFTGTIPNSWSVLTRLTALYVDVNLVSGVIPTYICNLRQLQSLNVGFNFRLTGIIPPCLGNLKELVKLRICKTSVMGTLPASLAYLPKLEHFKIDNNNRLGGHIPAVYGLMPAVKLFFLSGNNLTGSVPYTLGNLKTATDFVMEYNKLTGTIPASLSRLSSCTKLLLDNNRLTGTIPAALGNLPNLRWLLLQGNFLSGTVPSSILRLPKLSFFNIANNWLTGAMPSGFTSRLKTYNIRSNYFYGRLNERMCPLPSVSEAERHAGYDWNSSVANNCLTWPTLPGATRCTKEGQRPPQRCINFCRTIRADGSGPCGGINKGICLMYRHPKWSMIGRCTCRRGYRRTRDGMNCVR